MFDIKIMDKPKYTKREEEKEKQTIPIWIVTAQHLQGMMGVVAVFGSKFGADCCKTRMEYISRYWLSDNGYTNDKEEQESVKATDNEWYYASADHYSIIQEEVEMPKKRLGLKDVKESL